MQIFYISLFLLQIYVYQLVICDISITFVHYPPKNVLLSGFKTENKPQKDKIEEQIEQLKREFGIKEHFLETALRQKGL